MKRKSKFKLPKANTSFALNINSMTDMFTIMLVFLLQTYSTNAFELKTPKEIRLPSSTAEKTITEALDISLSASELKLKDDSIAKIQNGKFEAQSLDAEDADLIRPLFAKLEGLAQANESITDPNKKITEIIFQADRSMPYSTLKKVLYTASAAGFPKIKLATGVGNN